MMASVQWSYFRCAFRLETRPEVEKSRTSICTLSVGLAALLLASTAAPALAQQAPNAGTLLRQQPRPAPQVAPPAAPPTLATPEVQPKDAGPKVRVSAVRVTGSKLIPAEELAAQLTPLVGAERSLADLQRGALALIAYYANKGYLARVLLPPQDIKDGVVEYRVVEGARAELKVDNRGRRIQSDRVQRFIDARLPAGAAFDLRALGDAVNILNQQPGAQVSATLAAGKGEHDVDVLVSAQDRPAVSYDFSVNNQGSKGTGVVQGMGLVTLANPTGRFDSLSLLVNAAEGSIYGRGEYSLAVGDRGLRLGVNASALGYKLVQEELSDLDASGSAVTAGLTATYPIFLRTALGLGLTGSAGAQHFVDRAAGGEISNRTIGVASVGLNGFRLQSRGGLFAGYQSFGVNLVGGDVRQNNADARLADAAGLHTTGGFAKLTWNVGLTRPLAAGFVFNGAAHGQFASTNLDSSQQFFLGGPAGVRGYPVAEGVGDDGWLASATVSHALGSNLQIGGFFDAGGVKVAHDPVAGGPRPNGYTLTSAGASLDWRLTRRATLNATVAAPVGDNPGAQPDGTNSDGSGRSARFWLSLNASF